MSDALTGSTQRRLVRVDALLHGTAPPYGAEVSWNADKDQLTIHWARACSRADGAEGLTVVFQATRGGFGSIYRGTMAYWIDPGVAPLSTVHPIRAPLPPTRQSIHRFFLTDDPPRGVPGEEEWVAILNLYVPAVGRQPRFDAHAWHNGSDDVPRYRWRNGAGDEFIAQLYSRTGVPEVEIFELFPDAYEPSTVSDLWKCVRNDFRRYIERACLVRYQCARLPEGPTWLRVCAEDLEEGELTRVDDNRYLCDDGVPVLLKNLTVFVEKCHDR